VHVKTGKSETGPYGRLTVLSTVEQIVSEKKTGRTKVLTLYEGRDPEESRNLVMRKREDVR
jgi:hypothetical protein